MQLSTTCLTSMALAQVMLDMAHLHGTHAGLVSHVKHDLCKSAQTSLTSMQALVEGREIERLLVRYYQLLERSGLQPEESWVADETQATIDTSTLGKYIGKLNNQTLSDLLSRMLNYLKAEDKDSFCQRTHMHAAPCRSQVCRMQKHVPCGPIWQPQSRHP